MPDIVMIVERLIKVLEIVSEEPKSISQISNELGVKWGSAKTYVDILQRLGWVEVKAVTGMPPKVVAVLTEKGKCVLECLTSLK